MPRIASSPAIARYLKCGALQRPTIPVQCPLRTQPLGRNIHETPASRLGRQRLLRSRRLCARSAPKPTPEQLAKTYEEDQLSLEKCGVPRNAGDDYRPTPLMADQTRAPRLTSTQKFHVETVATGLPNAWGSPSCPPATCS